MKNRLFPVALAGFVLAFGMFVGCGKESPTGPGSSIVGSWSMTTATMEGITITAGTTTMTMDFTFKSDNTYTMTSTIYLLSPAITETDAGTWSTSGSKLITLSTGETVADTVDYSLSGSTLTITGTDNSSGTPETTVLNFARK
ncbi:MAG: lipocalin family protein [Chitinispirillaceae bacterium]|nr:lipocalin family protein [Chitinispirillaceae bacterium]